MDNSNGANSGAPLMTLPKRFREGPCKSANRSRRKPAQPIIACRARMATHTWNSCVQDGPENRPEKNDRECAAEYRNPLRTVEKAVHGMIGKTEHEISSKAAGCKEEHPLPRYAKGPCGSRAVGSRDPYRLEGPQKGGIGQAANGSLVEKVAVEMKDHVGSAQSKG